MIILFLYWLVGCYVIADDLNHHKEGLELWETFFVVYLLWFIWPGIAISKVDFSLDKYR